MIDQDGYAVLGDLGISQHWDEEGRKLTKGVAGVGGEGSSERQRDYMDEQFASEFHPEQDVYSMAALYYRIITGNTEHQNFCESDLMFCDISEESRAAIIAGLTGGDTLESTPKSVLEFMRMLPGCQNLELPEIFPSEEEETAVDDDFDFDMDELDLPDFDQNDLP
jgi:hypothetical protein